MADTPRLSYDLGPTPDQPAADAPPAQDRPLTYDLGPGDQSVPSSGFVIDVTRHPRPQAGAAGEGEIKPPSGEPVAPSPGGILDRTGKDDPWGFVKNTATGLARLPTHIPGFLGEARETGELAGSNLASIVPGEKRTAKEIRDDFKRRNALDFDTAMSIHGPGDHTAEKTVAAAGKAFMDMPTGNELYEEHIQPHIGAYVPESLPGRVWQAGLESAMPMPGGKTGAVERIATKTPSVTRKVATSAPVVGGVMGGTAQGVGEVTGSPGLGMLASFVVPKAAGMVRPGPSAEAEAARRLAEASGKELPSVLDNLRTIAKSGYMGEAGSPLTLSEAGQAENIAHVEKSHGVANTQFGTDVRGMQGQRAEGQRGQLDTLTVPGRESTGISDLARQYSDQLHQQAEQATQHQQKIVDAVTPPEGKSAESTGKRAFDIADANNEKAREKVSEFYNNIDPDGKIHVNTMPFSKAAQDLIDNINPRVHLPAPEAEKVAKMAAALPPTMTFKELVEFDKTVGQALWRARKNGEGVDLLSKLQKELETARDGALDQRAAWEAGAVQRGEMKPEQTVQGRIQKQFAQGTATPGIPHDAQATVEATARQKQAKAAHAERMQTFEEGPVGSALNAKTPIMGSVPGSAFSAGPAGAEKTRAWLEAVKDMAVTELANSIKNGVVTPKDLQRWKTKYGPALSEIDKHDPGFSARFDQHAAEQQHLVDIGDRVSAAKDKFNKTELAKFLGYTTPEEVNDHIRRLMPGPKAVNTAGVAKLRNLVKMVQNDPRAYGGLRTAVAEWLKEQASSRELVPGPHGEPVYGSALGNYLAVLDNARPHLETVFGPGGYEAAHKVAEEMQRTKQMVDAKITKGGSDSAKNLVQFLNDTAEQAGTSHAMSTVEAFGIWEGIRELSHGAMTGDIHALGKAAALFASRYGIHKWSEMLARKRGEHANEQSNIIREALLDPEYGHALLEHGAKMEARAPQDLTDKLISARTTGIEASRPERAAGGSVTSDHAAHASRMVRQVAKIREQLAQTTKPLLNVHDNAIASALAAAREVA